MPLGIQHSPLGGAAAHPSSPANPTHTGSSLPSLAVHPHPHLPPGKVLAGGSQPGWRGDGRCRWGAVGEPVGVLFTTSHFLPLSDFSNCCCFCFLLPPLPLCLSLFLLLQPLATLSAFLASLGPPRPPHLPIMPPGPSLALRPRDWVWGASQPGLGALSGRQWCRRPLELRPSRRA